MTGQLSPTPGRQSDRSSTTELSIKAIVCRRGARAGSVLIWGYVFDGAGQPVPDALVELWSVDADGSIRARVATASRAGCVWRFRAFGHRSRWPLGAWTREPGAAQGASAALPPFFAVAVFARGLLDRLHTRIYLPTGMVRTPLEADPLLSRLEPTGVRRSSRRALTKGACDMTSDFRDRAKQSSSGSGAELPPEP